MTQEPLQFASISDVAAALRSQELSSIELTQLMLERIERFDGALNAFITVTHDLALEQAYQADEELRSGHDRGPLHGIPIAVKDLIATKGIRTTGGSKVYENWIPDHDAAVVKRLYDAGAVLLGKTGLHELAFGSTSVNPYFGAVANPWKLTHHPGGSSGGSAVAVAAGMAYAAIGTDTGCSVRQPAQCCGVVGHKPTFGLVSKTGVLPLVQSMDHVGPLTRSVRDAALVLQAIVGHDEEDPHSVKRRAEDYLAELETSVQGATVGVPRTFFFEGGDPEVIEVVERSLAAFTSLGASLVDVDISDWRAAYDAANVTFSEIVQAHGARLQERPDLFSEPFRRRYEAVARSSAPDYEAAQAYRAGFRDRVAAAMENCDVLAVPTSTVAAAPIRQQPRDHQRERRKNACIFDFTGQPSISVPCGFTRDGLPVGLMISGRMFEDATVFRFAYAFEQATAWHGHHPESTP
jgi:aspartyl-tRNA(Asn)/glutamyl-tRNA(Gln) amidotransferase subunit A